MKSQLENPKIKDPKNAVFQQHFLSKLPHKEKKCRERGFTLLSVLSRLLGHLWAELGEILCFETFAYYP